MPIEIDGPLRRVQMSWDEYLALPDQPRAEWVDGEAVIRMAPGLHHGSAAVELAIRLGPLFPDCFLVSETSLRLPRNRVRLPDLMLVRNRTSDEYDFVSEAPELVVEVLSRATRTEDTVVKSAEYADAGIGQYWIVDPTLRTIDAMRNVEGSWELIAHLDDEQPTGQVELDGVRVPLDLNAILRW